MYYYRIPKIITRNMSSLSDQLVLMKQSLSEVEEHLTKLQGGRKASSAKARASLMKLKKDSHSLRGNIMTYTKELPTKSRKKKVTIVEPEPEMPVIEPVREEVVEEVKKPRKPRTKKVSIVEK